ncbi:hypothetical protein Calla_0287 [Caldicellulosiruptor acetigenus 6A]|uniref:Uncharacterized protein n=1 Tax=Caldicellulosiruptor acetigenus 6A TaxID=632516 RepID=G2PX05_9FIRM|nr:hypothetical protein Calla_0287 [Caldicellulosiruptor acetigenus 6A]
MNHDILDIFHILILTGIFVVKFLTMVSKNKIPLILTIENISVNNIFFEVIEKYIPKINNRICVDHTNILNSFTIELLENILFLKFLSPLAIFILQVFIRY